MFKIRSATRLALTIGIVCASLLWMACGLQIIPNPFRPIVQERVRVTKAVAATVTTFAENQRYHDMQTVLDRLVMVNDQLISIGVRKRDRYVAAAGPHTKVWTDLENGVSTENQLTVKVKTNGMEWGQLQLFFQPLEMHGFSSMLFFPLPMIGFLACGLSLITWYVLSKTFKYMNPSQVVPGRVRSAFDTLAEGLMLSDPGGEIAHANSSFCDMVGLEMEDIIGTRADKIEWVLPESGEGGSYPWNQCIVDLVPVNGTIIEVANCSRKRKFIVNSTPILGEKDDCRGVLTSFDDVTDLEAKKEELNKIVSTLRRSRDEVEKQNEQLNFLANYDPMTKCMNRRAFWLAYETMWKSVEPDQLSIMMVDVDFFKAINDNYGHSVGDEVLIGVGDLLKSVVRDRGSVCRYGGEEFAVLCPNLDFDDASVIAGEIVQGFRDDKIADLEVTVSVGVSNRSLNAMDPQHLLDQADQCLYAAKRNGRDQVVRFDECPSELDDPAAVEDVESTIEYSSVTGLLSALSFRSPDTSQHSLRVADLAVAVGRGMLSRRELYKLEVSALLHDIGKIGVPDNILNKPGPLTSEEWKTMSKHDEIGVAIVQSAFACPEIAETISSHHYCFSVRNSAANQKIYKDEIPLAARILSVCDAFDAMVSDRVYRKGMSLEDAKTELLRCTPDQFDPEIVEKLILHVDAHGYLAVNGDEFCGTAKSALSIGKHIELLSSAIHTEDVNLIQKVVDELKTDALNNQIEPIASAALRLNDALDANDSDIDQVLELADEVMDLCRSTRSAFVETAKSTIED